MCEDCPSIKGLFIFIYIDIFTFENRLSERSTLPDLVCLNKSMYVRQDPDCQGEYGLRVLIYECTVCMAGYPSENALVSEVKCNRIIENKRNKTEKKEI